MSDEQRTKKAGDLAAFPGRPVGMGSVVGMSKREFFAVTILSGAMSDTDGMDAAELCEYAVAAADELIKQLSVKKD